LKKQQLDRERSQRMADRKAEEEAFAKRLADLKNPSK